MNEFTLQELEEIIYLIQERESLYGAYGRCNLHDKVLNMIDNYCEHESDGYCYYKSGIKATDFLAYASSESACYLKCKKCMELYK